MRFAIFIFKLVFFIPFCLCFPISSQSDMNMLFNIMSHPKTNWPVMDCTVVWYVLRTTKYIDADIPKQGSSSSR